MTRWAGEGDDWVQGMQRHPLRKGDVIVALLKMRRQPTTHLEKNPGSIASKKPRDLDNMVLEPPTNAEGIGLEISIDGKTVADWISGHAKQRTTDDAMRPPRNN